MSMGGGPGANIEIAALRHMTTRDWGGAMSFVVQRRHGDTWTEVVRFHDPREAANWVDEAVARGEGTLEDYSVLASPRNFRARHGWARILLVAALGTFVVIGGLLFLYFVLTQW